MSGRRGTSDRDAYGKRLVLAVMFLLLLLAGCQAGLGDQPQVQPFEPNRFFTQSQSARPIPDNAVPRQRELEPEWLETGRVNNELVATIPAPLSEDLLRRGQEQYRIYCAPCHGESGYGDGMVVRRGFPAPASLHEQRLRQAPAGYYFEVISSGQGDMFSYASRVAPRDRWAIVAYIRALQVSQGADVEQLPEEDRRQLQEVQP
ncbi:MAG TPA: cytochrome c [Candidatus Sulfomarinibacteraceae bacterium]|nr:cytochrome c [Candidatus Sulfomarinibacteraceae bacterium]